MEWIQKYNRDWLSHDLTAGLTVGVMLIPQGMAYSMLAGLPPIHGLYVATIPLVLYAVLGTSRQLSVGPTALISLLTAAGISSLGLGSLSDYLLYATTLALMVGLMQWLMGVLRIGFVVNFLSHPVISGFTSAAAIIIGLSQLKYLLAIDLPRSEYAQDILIAAFRNIDQLNGTTLCIGLGGIIGIKGLKYLFPRFPSSIFIVVLSILVVWFFDLTQNGVMILGAVPSGTPNLSLPSFEKSTWLALLPTMFTISLVGFMESYAVAKTIHAKHKDYTLNSDKELQALGIANIGAAFFQGYPVTGSFSRSAVNHQSGAKSGLASIIAAILVILTLLFLTPLFYYLPNAILAAIIIVAVMGLVEYKQAIELWRNDRSDFMLLVITFLITLTLGITTGIIAGMALSLLVVVYRTTRPHVAILAKVPDEDFYRNIDRFDDLEIRDDVLIIRFDGPLYYANINYFQQTINKHWQQKGDKLQLIILNADSITHIDSSAGHMLQDWLDTMQAQNIQVFFTSVLEPVDKAFERWGLVKKVGEEYFFDSNQAAVDAFDEQQRASKPTTF